MIRISNTQVWVHDQDEALAFYTQKLGMEVRADVTAARDGRLPLADRWPGRQADMAIVLMAIPARVMTTRPPRRSRPDGERASPAPACSRPTTARPATTSCKAGVEFPEVPEERPYGVDAGFRDRSGNTFRLTEVREMTAV